MNKTKHDRTIPTDRAITDDFRDGFSALAERYRFGESPMIGANSLAYVFDDSLYAHGNGNRAAAMQIATLAALKLLRPDVDIRDMSDVRRDDYPEARNLNKIVANWIRRNFDPSLCGADPGAGMRRGLLHASRYDQNYGGHFDDQKLRDVFLTAIDLIDAGHAAEVFQGCLRQFQRMADSRRVIQPASSPINDQRVRKNIEEYVRANPGERGQLVVWAVAREADAQVKWNKDATSNDHGQVADVNGDHYGVEVGNGFIQLAKTQDVCVKARRSGTCERVTLVSMQSAACKSDAERNDIEETIARQFPEINIQIMTFDDYLDRMVNGVNVTWANVCNRIARGAQNLHPVDSNAWIDLLANNIGY